MKTKRKRIPQLRWGRVFAVVSVVLGTVILLWQVGLPRLLPLTTQFIEIDATYVKDVEWHPDSDRFVTSYGYVYWLDPAEWGKPPRHVSGGDFAWSSNGNKLVSVGNEVWIWNGEKNILLAEMGRYREYSDVEWCKDDTCIVVSSVGLTNDENYLWIWDAETLELTAKIEGDKTLEKGESGVSRGFYDIERIPNNNLLVTSSWNNGERIWDIESRSPLPIISRPVSNTAIIRPSHSGEYLAIEYEDSREVLILSLATEQETSKIESNMQTIDIMAWNHEDTQLFTGSLTSSEIRVWQVETSENILVAPITDTRWIRADWHPTGEYIVVGTDDDVRLWNVNKKKNWLIMQGDVRHIRWSPDGEKLIVIMREGLYVFSDFDQIAEIEF